MQEQKTNGQETYTIDLMHIFKSWMQRIWLIVLCSVLAAAIGFVMAQWVIDPEYSSSVMLYVNNKEGGNGNNNITSADLTASQSLVKTYGVILNNRVTLERVIEEAKLPYTTKQLSQMISTSAENSTEVMKVTVTCGNPDEAAKIANCIADVLPDRISAIIDGATMEIVSDAIPEYQKIGPSRTTYTLIGFLLGLVACLGVLTVLAILDDTIHDDNYIMENYKYPILAKIPDLLESNDPKYSSKYSYYKKSSHRTNK